MFSDFYVSFT